MIGSMFESGLELGIFSIIGESSRFQGEYNGCASGRWHVGCSGCSWIKSNRRNDMAERTKGFTGAGVGSGEGRFGADTAKQADPIRQVRDQVEHLVEGIDIQAMTHQLEDFGRRNPVALALSAFTVGVAAGILMRKRMPLSPMS